MLEQDAGVGPDQDQAIGDAFEEYRRDPADQEPGREDQDGPGLFTQPGTAPLEIDQQGRDVGDRRYRDLTEIDRKRQPDEYFPRCLICLPPAG